MQVIEDMEESLQSLLFARELLYIINYEAIYALIEVYEIIGLIIYSGIDVLYLKKVRRNIEHTLLGVLLTKTHTNGIDQMRLSAPAGTEDEEGIEGPREKYRFRR
jgi:hypothetical protein